MFFGWLGFKKWCVIGLVIFGRDVDGINFLVWYGRVEEGEENWKWMNGLEVGCEDVILMFDVCNKGLKG